MSRFNVQIEVSRISGRGGIVLVGKRRCGVVRGCKGEVGA